MKTLNDLVKATQAGELAWDILCQTTEYNDISQKPTKTVDGETWVVDECFVSYHCVQNNQEFLMITYENIHTCGEKQKTNNLIFLPPLGNRFFSLDTLAPYAVEAEQMLVYDVHLLWNAIMEQYRSNAGLVRLEVSRRAS